MWKLNLGMGVLVGLLLTASVMGLMYLADNLAGLPFVPYDLFDWVTRVLPGPVITFGIDLMIDSMRLVGLSVADSAKTAEQISAIMQFLLIGVAGGTAFFAVMRVRDTRPDVASGLVVGALFGLPMLAISIAIGGSTVNSLLVFLWLAVVFLVWGVALSQAYLRLVPVKRDAITVTDEARSVETVDRRQFLIRLGAATATITVLSAGVGEVLARATRRELDAEIASTMAHQSQGSPQSPFPNVSDSVLPAPGTRPEYTPIKDHYKVFLRVQPTVIDGTNYTLPITGSIDNTMMLTLDDIRNNYESMDHYVTLSCISGRLGTDLISTTQWTGVSMQRILADAKVRSSAKSLFIRSGDGFYETIPLDEIADDERIMLTYAWDGNTLPVDHGFPLRIWRPDRYGMKQPKWITSMEVLDEFKEGYWVERGWSEVARVKTVSVVDTVAVDAIIQDGDRRLVPVGGIAFAGARGISKVEVSVNGGPWEQAKLRAPLSDTTWVIWRYDWPFEEGRHTFAVRASERDGTPQIEVARPNRPSGATGIHSLRAG